jgi:hypothetical protein
MRLEVVWTPVDQELDGDVVIVEHAVGFDRESLNEVALPAGVSVTAGAAGYGKGAAGTGVALILEVAEHAVNDVGSLVGIGIALRSLLRHIAQRRARPPAAANAASLASLAAARTTQIHDAPDRWYHSRTVPLTTDGSVGTDMRDVWASTFVNETTGTSIVVFSSSTTRHLGSVTVPIEWWFNGIEGRVRTDDELRAAFRTLT